MILSNWIENIGDDLFPIWVRHHTPEGSVEEARDGTKFEMFRGSLWRQEKLDALYPRKENGRR